MNKKITLVKQETKLGCGSACVAMVLGISFWEAVELTGTKSRLSAQKIIDSLKKRRVYAKKEINRYRPISELVIEKGDLIVFPGAYTKIIALQSLRSETYRHYIVADYRGNYYDPLCEIPNVLHKSWQMGIKRKEVSQPSWIKIF